MLRGQGEEAGGGVTKRRRSKRTQKKKMERRRGCGGRCGNSNKILWRNEDAEEGQTGVPLILKQDVNNGEKWLNLITHSQPAVFLSPGVSHYLPLRLNLDLKFSGKARRRGEASSMA